MYFSLVNVLFIDRPLTVVCLALLTGLILMTGTGGGRSIVSL